MTTQPSPEITREEFELLAAEVAGNKVLARQAYNLARQLHLFLKATSFQYANLVDELNEKGDK